MRRKTFHNDNESPMSADLGIQIELNPGYVMTSSFTRWALMSTPREAGNNMLNVPRGGGQSHHTVHSYTPRQYLIRFL